MSASASSSSCSQVKLPLAPEDITPGWLSSMLGHRVKSFERTRDIFATTTKLYLKLTYENEDSARLDRPACVVVKAGLDPAIMQAYPLLVTLYRREAEWFAKVAPLLTHMEVPRAWRSEWNDEQGGVLILEDLTARGCTFGAPTDLWTVDMILEGAEQLAALHASTWGWSRETKPWLNTRHYDDIILNMMDQCRYADFIKLDYRPKVPAYLHDEARTRAVLRKHFASRNPRFQCLLHGDPHPSNTYFVQEGKPRFLDWQVVDVGSCFHDLAYFALGALTIEDRRANETRILDHYLDALARFGGPNFSREDPEVWLEYQKSCLAGFAWCITPRESQPESYINAMVSRYMAAFEDHNLFELIESLPEPTAV